MNSILTICLLASIPVCVALNCYVCTTGVTGCNDPFNATSSNVITTGDNSTNTYCVKVAATSNLVARYGANTCTSTTFVFGIGMACCQTNLCNGAQANYQISILIILSIFVTFFKFY